MPISLRICLPVLTLLLPACLPICLSWSWFPHRLDRPFPPALSASCNGSTRVNLSNTDSTFVSSTLFSCCCGRNYKLSSSSSSFSFFTFLFIVFLLLVFFLRLFTFSSCILITFLHLVLFFLFIVFFLRLFTFPSCLLLISFLHLPPLYFLFLVLTPLQGRPSPHRPRHLFPPFSVPLKHSLHFPCVWRPSASSVGSRREWLTRT